MGLSLRLFAPHIYGCNLQLVSLQAYPVGG